MPETPWGRHTRWLTVITVDPAAFGVDREAIRLALEAIGLQRGDEVITTLYTFAATAEVIRYFDANPVLVDIHPDDFNIDPAQVEAAITPRTKAIIPVHIAGLPADLDALYALAAQHNLAVSSAPPFRIPHSPFRLFLLLRHQDHHHGRGSVHNGCGGYL